MKYLYSLAVELRHLKDINRRYIWKKKFFYNLKYAKITFYFGTKF